MIHLSACMLVTGRFDMQANLAYVGQSLHLQDAVMQWVQIPPTGSLHTGALHSPRSIRSERGISLPSSLQNMKFDDDGNDDLARQDQQPVTSGPPGGVFVTGYPPGQRERLQNLRELPTGQNLQSLQLQQHAAHVPPQPFASHYTMHGMQSPRRRNETISAHSSFQGSPRFGSSTGDGLHDDPVNGPPFLQQPGGNGVLGLQRSSGLSMHSSNPMPDHSNPMADSSTPMPMVQDRQQYSAVAGEIPNRLSFLPHNVPVVSITRASSV